MTQCGKDAIKFKALGSRSVVADFNGKTIWAFLKGLQ